MNQLTDLKIIHIKHDKNFVAFVAMNDDNQPIGWANMTLQIDNRIKLQDAFVLEPYRRQGVYKAIWEARMEYILKHYANRGFSLYAYCKPTSIGQFRKHGFDEIEQMIHVTKEI